MDWRIFPVNVFTGYDFIPHIRHGVKMGLHDKEVHMRLDIVYAVLALTLLTGAAATAIALTSPKANPARMAVALHLAKIALMCAAALAALLGAP